MAKKKRVTKKNIHRENENCCIAEALGWSSFDWIPSNEAPVPSRWFAISPSGMMLPVPSYTNARNGLIAIEALEEWIQNNPSKRYEIKSPLIEEKRGFYEVSLFEISTKKGKDNNFGFGSKIAMGLGDTLATAFIACVGAYMEHCDG